MKFVTTKTSVKFVINGRESGSLDEAPEADRQLIATAQHAMASPHPLGTVKTDRVLIQEKNGVAKYTINGREYASLDEVPETERRLIENARLNLKNLGPAAAGSREVATKDKEEMQFFALGPEGGRRFGWTFKLNLTTLLWLLIGLAVATAVVGLVMKGLGR